MKYLTHALKSFFHGKTLIILALLFLLIRIPLLDQMYLLHDERDIVLTGYSIARSGFDLNGLFLPLSFENIHPKTSFLTIYYTAIWWLLIPFRSVDTARMLFVLTTTLFPFLIFHLIQTITKKSTVALMSAVVFCFNPWIFHMSRLALEVNLALVLSLAASILLLREKRVWSYVFFFLAFYTYQGYRILIPFLLIYLELYFIHKKGIKKTFIDICKSIGFFIFLVLSSLGIDKSVTNRRLEELIFFDVKYLSNDVVYKRNSSIAPTILEVLFFNKVTASIDYILNIISEGVGFKFLFKQGDPDPVNGTASAGQFFMPYSIFFYLGIIYSGIKKKWKYIYPIGFIIVGMTPSMINSSSTTFAFRSSFSSVGFSFLIGAGVVFFFSLIKSFSKTNKRIILSVLLGLFLVSTTHFAFNYYYRRPIIVSEHFFERERQLAQYLMKNTDRPINIYTTEPSELYLSYILIDSTIPFENIRGDYSNTKTMKVNNKNFINCNAEKNFLQKEYEKMTIISEACLNEKQYSLLQSNLRIVRIPYHDYSFKYAYFIFE